jgi:hypothetical protein
VVELVIRVVHLIWLKIGKRDNDVTSWKDSLQKAAEEEHFVGQIAFTVWDARRQIELLKQLDLLRIDFRPDGSAKSWQIWDSKPLEKGDRKGK